MGIEISEHPHFEKFYIYKYKMILKCNWRQIAIVFVAVQRNYPHSINKVSSYLNNLSCLTVAVHIYEVC